MFGRALGWSLVTQARSPTQNNNNDNDNGNENDNSMCNNSTG